MPSLNRPNGAARLVGFGLLFSLCGCGGDDPDFSKPTASGGNPQSFRYSNPHSGGSDSGGPTKKSDDKTPDQRTEDAAKKPADKKSDDKPNPLKSAGDGNPLQGGKASDGESVATVIKATAKRQRVVDQEDDEDQWKGRPFKFGPREQSMLVNRRRMSISPDGSLVAGLDEAGEVRVFETRYGRPRALFAVGDARPNVLAISRAAGLVVVGTDKKMLRVFEVADLSRLDSYARAGFHKRQVARAAYPTGDHELTTLGFAADGRRMIAGTLGGEVRIRIVPDVPGESWPAVRTLQAHASPILATALSPDGTQLATSALDGSVKVWNADDGLPVYESGPSTVPAFAVAWRDHDLITGRGDGTIEIWSGIGSDGLQIRELPDRNRHAVTALHIEPRKGLLLTSLITGAASLVDLKSGKRISSIRQRQRAVLHVATSPDHQRVLSVGSDGTCSAWRPKSLRDTTQLPNTDAIDQPVRNFRVAVVSTQDDDEDISYTATQLAMLKALRELPDDKSDLAAKMRLVTESDRGPIRDEMEITQPESVGEGPQLIRKIVLPARNDIVTDIRVALSHSGETVTVAVSPPKGQKTDGIVAAWDVPSGVPLRSWSSHRVPARLEMAGNAQWIVPFPRPDRGLEATATGFFELKSGQSFVGGGEPCTITRNSERFVLGLTGHLAKSSTILEAFDRELRKTGTKTAFEAFVPAAAFLPDGRLVASIRERKRNRLVLLSGETLDELAVILDEKIGLAWLEPNGQRVDVPGISEVAVSPKGATFVTHGRYARTDYRFTIWRKKNGQWRQEDAATVKQAKSFLRKAAVGPAVRYLDEKSVAALTHEGILIFGVESGRVTSQIPVTDVLSMFHPSGQWVAMQDETSRVGFVDLRNPSGARKEFQAQEGPVTAMAMSGNGEYLATVGAEHTLKVWRIAGWLR